MTLEAILRNPKVTMLFIDAALILLLCGLNTRAQNLGSDIQWEDLQTTYQSFYEISPHFLNTGKGPIYFDSYFSPFVDFERFDSASNSWELSGVWQCGTGYKPSPQKLNSMDRIAVRIDRLEWDEITLEDSIGVPKFKKRLGYDGTGTYRFKLYYGIKKSRLRTYFSYSPTFEVVEKVG